MRIRRYTLAGALAFLSVVFVAGPALAGEKGPVLSRPGNHQKPLKIDFGVYLMDIDEINGQEQNFKINAVVLLRWKDSRLAHPGPGKRIVALDSIWHPEILLTNRQARLRMPLPRIAMIEPDGTVTFRQQYVGPLSQRLRLRDFPLDTQEFSIHFALTGIDPRDVELTPGAFPGGLVGGGMAKVLSLPDWGIVSYRAEVKPYRLSALLQAPGFAFEFTARRHSIYFIWQAAMPLILIVMMSWVPFWVDPRRAEMQFAIASSTVLTLIAFRFTLAAMLPPLPYLTRLDMLTIGGTILVFMAFLQVVITSLLAQGERLALARRIDKLCRIIFPLIFIGLIILARWI